MPILVQKTGTFFSSDNSIKTSIDNSYLAFGFGNKIFVLSSSNSFNINTRLGRPQYMIEYTYPYQTKPYNEEPDLFSRQKHLVELPLFIISNPSYAVTPDFRNTYVKNQTFTDCDNYVKVYYNLNSPLQITRIYGSDLTGNFNLHGFTISRSLQGFEQFFASVAKLDDTYITSSKLKYLLLPSAITIDNSTVIANTIAFKSSDDTNNSFIYEDFNQSVIGMRYISTSNYPNYDIFEKRAVSGYATLNTTTKYKNNLTLFQNGTLYKNENYFIYNNIALTTTEYALFPDVETQHFLKFNFIDMSITDTNIPVPSINITNSMAYDTDNNKIIIIDDYANIFICEDNGNCYKFSFNSFVSNLDNSITISQTGSKIYYPMLVDVINEGNRVYTIKFVFITDINRAVETNTTYEMNQKPSAFVFMNVTIDLNQYDSGSTDSFNIKTNVIQPIFSHFILPMLSAEYDLSYLNTTGDNIFYTPQVRIFHIYNDIISKEHEFLIVIKHAAFMMMKYLIMYEDSSDVLFDSFFYQRDANSTVITKNTSGTFAFSKIVTGTLTKLTSLPTREDFIDKATGIISGGGTLNESSLAPAFSMYPLSEIETPVFQPIIYTLS